MQQIYKSTPMPKYDSNKVALQLSWSNTSALVFSCKFAAYYQNIFSTEHRWTTASVPSNKVVPEKQNPWQEKLKLLPAFRNYVRHKFVMKLQ